MSTSNMFLWWNGENYPAIIIIFNNSCSSISIILITETTVFTLTLVMRIKLRCHAHFEFSANQITWSKLFIQIQILNNKYCRSRSVGFFRSQLIWIYTVCKGRVYLGSAGQGLTLSMLGKNFSRQHFEIFFNVESYFLGKIRNISSICHLLN